MNSPPGTYRLHTSVLGGAPLYSPLLCVTMRGSGEVFVLRFVTICCNAKMFFNVGCDNAGKCETLGGADMLGPHDP